MVVKNKTSSSSKPRRPCRSLALLCGFGVVAVTNYFLWMTLTDEGENQRKILMESMEMSFHPIVGGVEVGRQTELLKEPSVVKLDMYAGAWLQSRDRFCDSSSTQLEKITNLEAATFVTFLYEHNKEVRMTKDWLDFSVEHLSKWWVAAGFWGDLIDKVHENALHKILGKYIQHSQQRSLAPSFFQSTLSIIPFIAWLKDEPQGELKTRARKLSVLVLAATLETLVRAGIPRVIVAVIDDSDLQIVREAVDLLAAAAYISGEETTTNPKLMQVTAIPVKLDKITLLPKVALMELRSRLMGLRDDGSPGEALQERHRWLGPDLDRWKYVYFTEADTILNFRPSSLPTIEAAMNEENALIMPHRIIAVPHQSDLEGLRRAFHYIPADGILATVTELDVNAGDACCDAGNEHPGRPPAIPTCGNFWYMCDFGPTFEPKNGMSRRHQRLEPYGVMRLSAGTGFVVAAGSESARRCIPRKQATCD